MGMGKILSRFVLPMLLLSAALLNWSLLSLVDLSFFLILLFIAPTLGSQFQRRHLLVSCCICIFSFLALLSHAAFCIVWAIGGNQWSTVNSKWAKLVGFMRGDSQSTSCEIYVPIIRVLTALVALTKVSQSRFQLDVERYYCLERYCSFLERLGSHLRVVCYLLLPPVQLIVGISHPSWVSFPFFICSSIGLVDWSLTSNVLGLFRWWRYLLPYAALNIFMLYVYQLPVQFSGLFKRFPEFIGIYKISAKADWSEICSPLSLLVYYILLSWIRRDLEEMDIIMSLTRDSDLTEQLIPSKPAFSLFETRSGVRHANFLLWKEIFQTFSINFFAYGFPLLLLALSFWSFHFASLCSLGLLAYVGYVIYAFPSMVHLHRLNGLLLVFILLWAASTYFFNLAFSFLNKRFSADMEIWETIGLWHYPVPGFYLLAQFCLGILVAIGNLVFRNVFLCSSGSARLDENNNIQEQEERKVFVIATVAWLLRKSSRAIVLLLTFLLATKPGFIHAAYMIFFLVYLLRDDVSKKLCRSLVLLCEAHFALLYIVRLNLISKQLGDKRFFAAEMLEHLGLDHRDCSGDFLETAVLACLCSIHNHGIELLFSFSAVVQQTPFPPIGFSILRAGLIKSVIFSVYASPSAHRQHIFSSHERRIMSYLSTVGWKFLSVYHSWGTYISFVTILVAVYLVRPNCVSFGYLFFLLLWISGRQLLQRTTRHLWFPLKIYAVAVFVFVYGLSVFSEFRTWVSRSIDPHTMFGYDPEASILKNISGALIVLITIQLFSYERARTVYVSTDAEAPSVAGLTFFKRLLVWHSEKMLYCAVLYASLSPISSFGFLYLLGLVLCSILPKSSPVPPKLFLVYSGLMLMIDYQFQMWGDLAEMFPGQEHYQWSLSLGLRLHKHDFWGLELGFRGKVVVIVACIIHYNIFHWMKKAPQSRRNVGKWDEVCSLFDATEETLTEVTNLDRDRDSTPRLDERRFEPSSSWPVFGNSSGSRGSDAKVRNYRGRKKHEYLYTYFWENHKGSHKWNRRRTIYFRRERLHKQKVVLKIFAKYWIENMFSLFGLEINMVVLLLASFAVLNAISLLYIASLAVCVLLNRRLVRRLWPVFVFLFASVVGLEYLALWVNMVSMDQPATVGDSDVTCHDCWRSSDHYFEFCKKCWIGVVVDDSRMLISYYMVFMFSCFKLRADHLSSRLGSQIYHRVLYHYKSGSLLSDLSFETKELWTLLDYLRHYSYCHLLDLNLVLILITGTLEYDILHLGYLGFALLFFRMRVEILKEKNRIFKYLRIYNFVLIVLSLAYQSPFITSSAEGKCAMADYVSQVIGFYKYDYGFRITSRSALVEIVIFMLVSAQSYMFSSQEFDYVSKYLEAEQIGAIVREQENRTAWKSAQLQQIRKFEEKKRQRILQVEKMKSEMLNLQLQLHSIVPTKIFEVPVSDSRRTNPVRQGNPIVEYELHDWTETGESMKNQRSQSPSIVESSKLSQTSLPGTMDDEEVEKSSVGPSLQEIYKAKLKSKDKENNPLVSAVNLIGDGVSQVQSLGNLAVNNLATLLNIEDEKYDKDGDSSDEDTYYEIESQSVGHEHMERAFSIESTDGQRYCSTSSCPKLGTILLYVWGQMRSNNDVVCYCCFVLTYLWSFSILSMVYLSALFLYVLCLNTDPGYLFWVVMLIYTEAFILLQYLYQIVIQHCGLSIDMGFLQELGFPEKKIMSSFVSSNLPIFMVYLFTLLQTSIIARDGNWKTIRNFSFNRRNPRVDVEATWHASNINLMMMIVLRLRNMTRRVTGGLCRYWKSLTRGAETPPYFVQLTMDVKQWPEDGIQPERIETGMNELLSIVHDNKTKSRNNLRSASKVRIQSIERSTENPNIGLVVFEVLYASPVMESSSGLWHESLTPAADVASEILMAKGACIFEEIGFPYPIMSVVGGGKREVDLYAYIFCADLVVFFLVAMFYQSIIKNKSEFLEVYQLEDQFPKEFVFILMVIFFLIVLDRIIYLCSFATGKVLFYLFSFVLFTYSVARYAWYTALPNKPAGRIALRAIYLTKAVSLALQAIQIRFGIPHESTLYRQFLTRRVTKLKYWGFRIYRALPFLYELRCVLDWSCTTTSLTMYDWLKLEDIHSSLFLVKCDVNLNRSKHRHGEKQSRTTKFYSGICLFSALICIIWTPMLMYSSGNPTNIANPIKDASVRVDIKSESGRLTLYETSLCQKLPWESVGKNNKLDPWGYLSPYNVKDIQLICCVADANTLWLVPPAVRARFIESLKRSMKMVFSWQLIRDRPKGKEVVNYEIYVEDFHLPEPSVVMDVLNGTANNFTIYDVYPRFFRVTGSGDVRFFEQEVELVSGDLIRNGENPEWWSFHDVKPPEVRRCGNLAGPMAVVVSEETPQGILGETLSKFSIWGLYITFVLAVGRFFRLQCADLRLRIPFENLPSCERLLGICEDIYAARAEGELEVEEVLYWTLIKIYRSPHMLLEYTKPD